MVRAKSKWTPGGISLWLIAAILATVIVCSQSEPPGEVPSPSHEIEFELEPIE
ncbi:MAG: hypothetical protein ACN4G0_18130 [Polyangiales bacterium]